MSLQDKFDGLSISGSREVSDRLHSNTQILEKYGHRIKTDELSFSRGKSNKDKANRATVENVLDPRTMRFLQALINRHIISDFNGCLSTGKEANVYHAFAGDHDDDDEEDAPKKEYAVKIYKTSILVFKDREKYVDGEFRFRNSRSQHNPRKMIKIWAEKEFRNLKRIYQSGIISVPKPIEVKSNVLVMEFLSRGDGFASPRLKDYPYKNREEIAFYYHTTVAYIRLLYQYCRLVHADLSEYNLIIHNSKLYIIDVSQSVEPEHPLSLDFLRMDIKNINAYFDKMGIDIFAERVIFQFVISEELEGFAGDPKSAQDLTQYVSVKLPIKSTAEAEAEDEVFRSLHLVRNLGGLEERDFDRFTEGKFDLLKTLIANDNKKNYSSTKEVLEDGEADSDSKDDEDISSDDEDTSSSGNSDYDDNQDSKPLKGKKYEDKDEKKLRKQEAKEAKRERRKTKVKKSVKKKLVKKTKSKK